MNEALNMANNLLGSIAKAQTGGSMNKSTGQFDLNKIEIREYDILSLNGSEDFDSTGCGEVIKHNNQWVCFYGQDALGRDCFDILDTVAGEREVNNNHKVYRG